MRSGEACHFAIAHDYRYGSSHRLLRRKSGETPRRRQAFTLEWGQGNAHQESGWGEFLRQLQYKCEWHDRELVGIDRWFPSSKRCFQCGHVLDKLSLDIREWQCPSCNNLNLRDYNAALNILAVGQTVLASGLSSDGDITSVSLVNLG